MRHRKELMQMYKEEILNRLVILRGKLGETQEEYRSVTYEIEELAYDLSNLENEQYRLGNREIELENEIQELEKRLMDKEFEEIDNALTGNEFRDAFIKCSWFCRKYDDNNIHLSYVRIEDDRLMATDGYKGIIVDCNNIPRGLRNAFIRWDIRENFEDNVERKPDTVLSIDDAIQKGRGDIKIKMNESEFREQLHWKDKGEFEILEHENKKIAFNKEYLDLVLTIFKGINITVYWPNTEHMPLVIKSENQEVMLCPVVLCDLDC